MPAIVNPEPPVISKWKRPVKTNEELEWADIKVIDLSKFDEPGGKSELAEELRDAVHHTGFFSITGTGFTQDEVDRQYDIGQAYFDLPLEDKGDLRYRCDFAQGNYFGYRAVCAVCFFGTSFLVADSVQGEREDNHGDRRHGQCRIRQHTQVHSSK
jgi:hypothetical protein